MGVVAARTVLASRGLMRLLEHTLIELFVQLLLQPKHCDQRCIVPLHFDQFSSCACFVGQKPSQQLLNCRLRNRLWEAGAERCSRGPGMLTRATATCFWHTWRCMPSSDSSSDSSSASSSQRYSSGSSGSKMIERQQRHGSCGRSRRLRQQIRGQTRI